MCVRFFLGAAVAFGLSALLGCEPTAPAKDDGPRIERPDSLSGGLCDTTGCP